VADLMRRSERPDIVHFHSEPEGSVIGAPLRTAMVLSYDNYFLRGGRESIFFRPCQFALRRFDALLAVSQYSASSSTAYWELPAERVSAVYNGVNLDQFRPDEAAAERERKRLSIDGPALLYLGRVCEQKGTDTLLNAYEIVRRTRSDVELLIAGPLEQFAGGEAAVDWPALIERAGAQYLGQVPDERLAGLMTLADVFVMPTRRLEMLGMAAVEAQACGTPVVASDHGGLPEAVPPGTGLLFPPGDSDALAERLLRLLSAPDLRQQYARRAREHAATFDWERIIDQIDAIYEDILRRRSI
jgi:glycosyltransferase involved in cell wall biosynthesis